ncbi:hypothetical protein [Fodinicurvata fenggangensis]|uniref:hypothetical protein n=1 Tax=Fodinicurvata fenggangensis TaxID=1121830 RepID=UPI00047C8F84|nr:hypothetical protein [Fodinicurvata fenggangensis]
MRIVYDRNELRLQVDAGDPLHPEALDTWREASALNQTCIDALPTDEAEAMCLLLAETATHALIAGRDDQVLADFRKVERRIRDADENLRSRIINDVLAIFLICLACGSVAGITWELVKPYYPWNLLPSGLNLAANDILFVLGWTGFTLVGFSIGWLFLMAGMVRFQDRVDVLKRASSLRQRTAHVTFNASVCLIIVIILVFFDGFDLIGEKWSILLESAPWAILLGLAAGVAEPALFERLRGFLKLS